ncbi:MAG TPA: EamA family transporter [Rudaea sp.]
MIRTVPPQAYFVVSALFHYLGPAFAVLLFAHIGVLGVAWLRIATAAVVFALWRRPWRLLAGADGRERRLLLAMGAILAVMNSVFYLAIARLPLGTVGAIEFLAPIALALAGLRSARNALALAAAMFGVVLLADVRIGGEPVGFLFAFANCALFAGYIVIGHRLAADGGRAGIDRLAAAMLIAMLFAAPIGFADAMPAFADARLLAAAAGVGICSSVIPYVCDQLAMARLPRATFALLLALLPATACAVGAVVLRQVPSRLECVGIAFVIVGVFVHRAPQAQA